jgi:hypothetical protein
MVILCDEFPNNIIQKLILKKYSGRGWAYLVQDMDKWGALVTTVTNIRFP